MINPLTIIPPCWAPSATQVWLRAVRYRLSRGEDEAGRKTVDRALQVRA